MNCSVCGNRIEEDEDMILLGIDRDFIHKRCQPMWEKFKEKINNMSNAEFYKCLSFNRQIICRK